MSPNQRKAIKGLVAAVVSALVAGGIVSPDNANVLTGLAGAVITAYAAFRI